jgi:hypothetical protein
MFIIALSSPCLSQLKKSSWNNKDKGTFIIYPHNMGFVQKDTTLTEISVKLYELSKDGCKGIKGNLTINNKVYETYDSTDYADSEGFKDPSNYFHIYLAEGEYALTAFVNKKYYPVKTGKLIFRRKGIYEFKFYLIRKGNLNLE